MKDRPVTRLARPGARTAFFLGFGLTALFSCLAPLGALAAEEAHDGWGILLPLGRWFNLLLLGGVIGFLLRRPIKSFLSARAGSIRDELRSSAEAYEKAVADKAAMEEKVRRIDEDLARIREESEREAEAERQRVRSQAAKDAERLIENARREIDNLTRAAQKELREYAAELTVELAEKKIRSEIRPEDERRVEEAFLSSLEQSR